MSCQISRFGPPSGLGLGLQALRSVLNGTAPGVCLLLFAISAAGQANPISPPPGFGQVPQGTGACSVEKSCADLAPLMIQSALGPSPLGQNLRALAESIGGHDSDSREAPRVVAWAVEALRQAGVDNVHMEKFTESGSGESENVVGEIRGRERPDEFILLGAHLGSWDLGTGVLDNACNAAIVVEAARVIHASGNIPRRSIRFALFSGENKGELGSRAYAHAHRAELDRMLAAIIYDSGRGRVTSFSLGGRKDLLAGVREALEPLKSFAPLEFTLDAPGDADDLDFALEGVPALVARQDAANYVLSIYSASDTVEGVDVSEMKRSAATAAVATYALADAATRIGHRQTRAEVEELLKDTGLEKSLKTDGEWAAWEKGERGRQP
jgi:Peptidase family M28